MQFVVLNVDDSVELFYSVSNSDIYSMYLLLKRCHRKNEAESYPLDCPFTLFS